MLIAEATLGGRATMLLRLYKENLGTEIGMIRKFIPLLKTTLLHMVMERKKTLVHKSIVLKMHLLFLT
jgi:hypothetical protein